MHTHFGMIILDATNDYEYYYIDTRPLTAVDTATIFIDTVTE